MEHLVEQKGLVIAVTVITALVSAGYNSISSRIRDIEYTYGGSPQAKMMVKLNVVNMTMLVSFAETHKLVTTD